MTRVLLSGACGRMGREVRDLMGRTDGFALAAGVDHRGREGFLPGLTAFRGEADVLVDFSHHTAAPALSQFLLRRGLPAVLCSTGCTEGELALLHAASRLSPVLLAPNTSLGAALLARMARMAAAAFPLADIEIIECHHTGKQDSPSGTALALAQAAGHGTRPVGIHSLRMGNVVGDHQVILNAGSQTISLRHEAHDRVLFAEGALAAARFLVGKPAGLYSMDDLFSDKEADR